MMRIELGSGSLFILLFFQPALISKKNDRVEDLAERDGTLIGKLFFVDEILPRRGVAQRHVTVKLREVV